MQPLEHFESRGSRLMQAGSFVPRIRPDLVRRSVDAESVVWSPARMEPFVLDPVATVMLDVIDGVASIDELVADVQDAVGVPHEIAAAQVRRVVEMLDRVGALVSSTDDAGLGTARELFANPPNT